MVSDIENEKRSLRKAVLALRASLLPERRAEHSRAICRRLYEYPALAAAERVMLYAAVGTAATRCISKAAASFTARVQLGRKRS